MKKQLLTLIIILSGWCAMAQTTTNTFPPTGNAGIGTTAPGANLVIQAATPELRFITTADSTNFARFLRSTVSSNNLFSGRNKVLQAGGMGKALFFPGTSGSQNVTLPENGLSTSSGFIVSFWFKASSIANQGLFGFSQPTTSSTTFVDIFTDGTGNLMAVGFNNPNGTFGIQGPVLNSNTNYHVVYYYQPGGVRLFVNDVEYTTHYGGGGNYWPQVAGQTFYLGLAPYTSANAVGVVLDQVLFYSALSSTDLATLYNGGNGTGNIPTTGLIRRYDFEEGTGTTAVDAQLTGYDATLNNGVQWTNSGIIPLPVTPVESTIFSSSDGLTNQEKGIATWGDLNGRNQQAGKWFQWKQGSNYPLVSNNAGHWLFDPNRAIDTLANVASTIDVAGNVTVGSAYAGTNAAPANGLIVQGNTGIGTPTPAYPLQINQPLNGTGTISVGASSGAVTGIGTKFLADFNVGDTIKANSETHIISAIASNTAMTTNSWTGALTNSAYTTTSAQRYAFTGKGSLFLGDAKSPLTGDALIQTVKTFNNNNAAISGMFTNITANQTTAPQTTGLTAVQNWATIGSTNTKGWGSVQATVSRASISSGALGTFNVLFGNQSIASNQSTLDTINIGNAYNGNVMNTGTMKSAYIVKGLINNPSGQIGNAYQFAGEYRNSGFTNASGLFLTGLGVATNNTGIYLKIGSATATGSAIPAGNWAIFDTTGYKSYFAGSIGIGTTDPKGYKLAVNGSVIATSVVVKAYANWPDYVFKKEHELMPLADLKVYVDKNQHLPEIPSAAEVEKNGLDLGEMNKLLMKKMEEMTLYMIEKDKQIKDQQAELKAQEQRLRALEQQIGKIAKKD